MTVTSDGQGNGSQFTVTLPLLENLAAPADRLSEPLNVSAMPRRRILVVDDNRDSATSMGMMLRLLNNEVATAYDGLEAVKLAEEFRPQVILMDVGMPRLNGLEATKRIRQQNWSRDLTIIALTGWGQESDRALTRAAGCDGHLVKPLNLPDLEQLLAQLPAKRERQLSEKV